MDPYVEPACNLDPNSQQIVKLNGAASNKRVGLSVVLKLMAEDSAHSIPIHILSALAGSVPLGAKGSLGAGLDAKDPNSPTDIPKAYLGKLCDCCT
ncbi:MAG: hypothetical protein A1D16_06930 [Flavihumibacter sp. CACIAM 22H1]|nr:MAG: hypothetical protein A1D16_06930 [Flavihumibacter sp. CACIAM 22H1]